MYLRLCDRKNGNIHTSDEGRAPISVYATIKIWTRFGSIVIKFGTQLG